MASAYSSFKWITSDESVLRAHDVRRTLVPVWNHPTNLVSIFGRARQGKSFLMNCLAGETDIFRISNEKESCTQGIDISNKFMSVRQFATVDGGHLDSRSKDVDNIKVGFVDAEGQGDKDVSYDANLICPILLASKCVIFNWKGDLQKDAILNTLGIMCRAAQNVGVESGSSHKFGHLHIVFRDWQAEGSTAEDTFQHIFQQENTSEASTRNKIRRDLHEAFTSIRVWLLDAPTELVSDLKKKLTIDKTSAVFRGQIRELRAALSQQLTTPARFGDSQLTGKVLHSAMSVMAETLNHGEVVLPGAAYRAMLAEELRANRDQFQREAQAKTEELLVGIRAQVKTAHGEVDDDAGEFASSEEVTWLFDEEIGAVANKYTTAYESILETTPGDHSYDGLRQQEKDAIAVFQQQLSEYFYAQWTNEVNKWVIASRQAAEKRLQRLITDVLQKMPALIRDGRGNHSASISSEMLLEAVMQEVWMKVSACFGSKQMSFQDNAIFVDAVQTLTQRFEAKKQEVWAKFEEAYASSVRENIEALAQDAGNEMLTMIEVLPRQLYARHFLGFPIDLYMMALNQEFHRLKAQIEQEVRRTLLVSGSNNNISEKIVQDTTIDVIATLEQQIAISLKGTAISQYKSFREEIFASIMKKAGEDFLPMLHRLAETWEAREPDLDNVDPDVPYYGPTLQNVAHDIAQAKTACEQEMVGMLLGWFCENAKDYSALVTDTTSSSSNAIIVHAHVQQNMLDNLLADFQRQQAAAPPSTLAMKFLVQLSEYLQSIITPFQQEARGIIQAMEEEYDIKQSEILEHREAIAAAEAAARKRAREEAEESEAAAAAAAALAAEQEAAMNDNNYDDDGEEEEQEQYRVTTKPAANSSNKSSTAVDEQRRRALEWAAKNLKTAAKGKGKAAAAVAAPPAATSRKTAGSRFADMKPKKTIEQQRHDALEFARRVFGDAVLAEEEDEEHENVETNRRNSSSSSSNTISVTSARGKSAIEAAKEAAKQLQEQRLRNQATDAAHRAKDTAEKKKRAKG